MCVMTWDEVSEGERRMVYDWLEVGIQSDAEVAHLPPDMAEGALRRTAVLRAAQAHLLPPEPVARPGPEPPTDR